MKEIKGYEGIYMITKDAKVINMITGRILKFDLCKGYYRVTLSKSGASKRYLLHRLVLSSFIGINEEKFFVNHKDGNKLNNCLENLEWVTISENEKHAHKYLGKIPPEAKTTLDLQTGIFYDSISKAAVANSIKPSTLLASISLKRNNRFVCFN